MQVQGSVAFRGMFMRLGSGSALDFRMEWEGSLVGGLVNVYSVVHVIEGI